MTRGSVARSASRSLSTRPAGDRGGVGEHRGPLDEHPGHAPGQRAGSIPEPGLEGSVHDGDDLRGRAHGSDPQPRPLNLRQEPGHHIPQPVGDPQADRLPFAPGGGHGPFEGVDRHRGLGQEHLTRLGEPHPLEAGEQLDADLLLQRPESLGKGGLGDVEHGGRTAQAARTGDGDRVAYVA